MTRKVAVLKRAGLSEFSFLSGGGGGEKKSSQPYLYFSGLNVSRVTKPPSPKKVRLARYPCRPGKISTARQEKVARGMGFLNEYLNLGGVEVAEPAQVARLGSIRGFRFHLNLFNSEVSGVPSSLYEHLPSAHKVRTHVCIFSKLIRLEGSFWP